jgi:HK97 gp10 family phage protein
VERVVISGDLMYGGALYYDVFVEFGTSKWAGQPFMRPAYSIVKGEAQQIFIKEARKGIKMMGRKVKVG